MDDARPRVQRDASSRCHDLSTGDHEVDEHCFTSVPSEKRMRSEIGPTPLPPHITAPGAAPGSAELVAQDLLDLVGLLDRKGFPYGIHEPG